VTVDLRELVQPADTKILLVIMDGLGGYADAHHRSELEDASTPHLDEIAAAGITGLLEPVGPGITPGSGPGHLGLFGYDPEEFVLGRGALSAAGLEFPLQTGDIAARGNLCTVDATGLITDRRAGRLPDDEASDIVARLEHAVRLDGAEVFFRHEREHRVLVVLRGEGLGADLDDTDPQKTGVPPLEPHARTPEAKRTAELISDLDVRVRDVLHDEPKANGILLRGFDTLRELPPFETRYGLRAAAVAIYPMYRGIAALLGMDVLEQPKDLAEELAVLGDSWSDYDYFFVHHKATDSAGEDGNRAAKIAAIEQLDAAIPALRALEPDVIAVSGDHSTPSQLAAHSWHPVPTLVWSERSGRDDVERFGERWCAGGALGIRPTKDLMAILLANAGRLRKYGA
jgi:2,3-bisphosphoglycerate-independent phosphoglycerate mutase